MAWGDIHRREASGLPAMEYLFRNCMYFLEKSKMAGGDALVEKLGWSLYSQGVCAGMTVWKNFFSIIKI